MPFICEICAKQFSRNYTLKRHQKDAHKCVPEPTVPVAKWSCTLCEYKGSPKKLDIHYEKHHKLVLKKEVLRFVGENSFNVCISSVTIYKSFCTDTSSRQFFIKEQKKLALKMECGKFKAFSPSKCSKKPADLKQSRLTPQKRLYSTKKKRNALSKNKHQAPSTEVKDSISCSLMKMIT
jgi:hypothetical protein